MSRAEALEQLEPQAKPKQKASKKLKKALKKINKNKPSLKKKKVLRIKNGKNVQKALADKDINKDVKAESKNLPAPLENQQEDHPFLKKEVVVTSELATKRNFGVQGTVRFFSTQGFLGIFALSGVRQAKPEWVELMDSKDWVRTQPWPSYLYMGKRELDMMLTHLHANPKDQAYIDESEADKRNYDTVFTCPAEINVLEDQRIWLGWSLLDWFLRKQYKQSSHECGINCTDPIFGKNC